MPPNARTTTRTFPQRNSAFFLKGAGAYDWGMQNRLARVFRPDSGQTVMLAVDHGYFQGPTTGLERIDVNIVPLVPYADALFCTRGILRSTVPAATRAPIGLRASGGPSILKELSNEQIAVDMEDAVRLNAAASASRSSSAASSRRRPSQHDPPRRRRLPPRHPRARRDGRRRELTRDARYLGLASRICAELGAQIVKTYYCEPDFETVTASCPVPIVMAGGKKLPELEALEMAYRAVQEGAAGVDMGRNIFQSDSPVAMLQAVRKVVHEGMCPSTRSSSTRHSGRSTRSSRQARERR